MCPAPVRTTRIAVAAAALVILPLLLLILQYGAGRDQGAFLAVARVMQAGGMPYRDAWDVKPPGIFLIYRAALLFGGGMLPVRALEALALVSQGFAFAVLTRRFTGSPVPGAWAGALAILIHAQLEFWHTAQPESFGGPVLAWALVLATSPANKSLARAAAGALFGFAACLKPPLAGGGVLVAAILAWRDARAATSGRVRAALAPFAAIAAGALAVVGVLLAWLAFGGAFPDFAETFRDFVPRYTALGLDPHGLPGLAWRAFFEWFDAMLASAPHLFAVRPAVEFPIRWLPGSAIDPSEPVVTGLSDCAAAVLNDRPEVVGIEGPCDMFVFHQFGIPAVLWGPRGGNTHAADEYVELDSVVAATKVLLLFVCRWCGVDA